MHLVNRTDASVTLQNDVNDTLQNDVNDTLQHIATASHNFRANTTMLSIGTCMPNRPAEHRLDICKSKAPVEISKVMVRLYRRFGQEEYPVNISCNYNIYFKV